MTTDFSERNKQTISDISQLQQKERDLYSILEDPSLSTEQRKMMIDEINRLSEMRMNMYADLQNMYSSYQDNINNLSDQTNTLRENVPDGQVQQYAPN